MRQENALALIVAYYFSKFDPISYEKLGYKTYSDGHQTVGRTLDVNPNTIKNMRDEFDSIHDNARVGWYQRELRPSRQLIVDKFQDMDLAEVHDIVEEILLFGTKQALYTLEDIVEELSGEDDVQKNLVRGFIVRGPTGRKAEEYFINFHKNTKKPTPGRLIDTRDLGCGYDFKIQSIDKIAYIEVKGLREKNGGMLFTSKEWDVAREMGKDYYVVFIRNIGDSPIINIIQNPADNLNPKKSIRKTVQVRWQISKDDLEEICSTGQGIPDHSQF